MRLFVAIVPPPPAVAHLATAVADLADSGLRWQPPERWHLTLAFLGDVTPAPISAALDSALAGVQGVGEGQLAGSGTFRAGRGGVLWVGVAGVGLAAFAGRVRAALPTEQGTFRLHVTLARWRGDPRVALSVAEALRQYAGPQWPVLSIELIRSHLGPAPRYETVDSWPLGRR